MKLNIPAVLRSPASAGTTSPITSPEVAQQEPYPWAQHTPEHSPRGWGMAPAFPAQPVAATPSPEESRLIDMWAELQNQEAFPQKARGEPIISRDVLRIVCEPFFEQMLTALEQALTLMHRQHGGKHAQIAQAMTQTKPFFDQMLSALQGALTPTPQQDHQKDAQIARNTSQTTRLSSRAAAFQPVFCATLSHDPALDEESTEADENSAFNSLLSGPSEGESVDGDIKPSKSKFTAQTTASLTPSEVLDPSGDIEKNTTVCRHWRSKGWCRLQESGCCKFAHPEHKRGVAVPLASSGGTADNVNIGKVAPGTSSEATLEAELCLTSRKKSKKGKKNRSSEKPDVEPRMQLAVPPGSWH